MNTEKKQRDPSNKQKKAEELQGRILAFIDESSQKEGRPPTVREIGKAVGKKSTGHVTYHLKQLRAAGKISQDSKISRGLQVVAPRRGIPIQGKIAAGAPLVNYEPGEMKWLDLKEPGDTTLFALRVQGKSMIESLIDDGDIVVVEPCKNYSDGDMIVAQHRDSAGIGEATLKRIYRKRNRMCLQPANSDMDPIYIPAKEWDLEWEVQGKVVSVVRHYNERLRH